MSERLLILGSTGSIGTQALDIVHADRASGAGEFELVGLSAERSWEQLVAQARAHGVKRIALVDEDAAARAAEAWTEGEVLHGPQGLVELVVGSGAELVLNALVGSAGLGPTVATLGEGIDLALANKESLVVGGELVGALAEATGAQLIPVDSEHTALHQLLAGQPPGSVERLTITASGGPFRGRSHAELRSVTPEQALAHPTWAMGGKITIDSATLMNKGLELMEAHHLFGTPYDRIDVVVHPQSLIHGLVQLADGAMLAHLGPHDMRIAISYALHGGISVPIGAAAPVGNAGTPTDAAVRGDAGRPRPDAPARVVPLDLVAVGALTFEAVDLDAFPCLRLAREAAEAGGTAPCVLNAANEVAVHAFLAGRLPFNAIPAVIEQTLARLGSAPVRAFESLYESDREARAVAGETVAARA
jgi:1-deoxy-D-xylulose-5-phosphate reductoisomerase